MALLVESRVLRTSKSNAFLKAGRLHRKKSYLNLKLVCEIAFNVSHFLLKTPLHTAYRQREQVDTFLA